MMAEKYAYKLKDYESLKIFELPLKLKYAIRYWSICNEFFSYYNEVILPMESYLRDCYRTLDPMEDLVGLDGIFRVSNRYVMNATEYKEEYPLINLHKAISERKLQEVQPTERFRDIVNERLLHTIAILDIKQQFIRDRFTLMKKYANFHETIYTKDCFFFASQEHRFVCKCTYEDGFGFRGKIITDKISIRCEKFSDTFEVRDIDRRAHMYSAQQHFFEQYLRDFYPEEFL